MEIVKCYRKLVILLNKHEQITKLVYSDEQLFKTTHKLISHTNNFNHNTNILIFIKILCEHEYKNININIIVQEFKFKDNEIQLTNDDINILIKNNTFRVLFDLNENNMKKINLVFKTNDPNFFASDQMTKIPQSIIQTIYDGPINDKLLEIACKYSIYALFDYCIGNSVSPTNRCVLFACRNSDEIMLRKLYNLKISPTKEHLLNISNKKILPVLIEYGLVEDDDTKQIIDSLENFYFSKFKHDSSLDQIINRSRNAERQYYYKIWKLDNNMS